MVIMICIKRASGYLHVLIDDVLKARLKTVGVSEYRFEMEVSAGRDSGTEWRIVDVGGSRSQVKLIPNCIFDLASDFPPLYSVVST